MNTRQNMRAIALTLTAAAGLLWSGASPAEAVITGVTIEDVSSELSVSFNRLASMTIDGSGGVPVGSFTGNHTAFPPDGNMWLSADNGCCGQPADPHVAAGDGRLAHIVWDLGAVYNVSSFRIWNYNENPPDLDARGSDRVEIRTSATSNLAGLALAGTPLTDPSDLDTSFNLMQAPGVAYGGELFNAPFTGRYVRMDIYTNHGGDNMFAGLSEIRFEGELFVPVPEPATAALGLLGLGALGMVARRRRGVTAVVAALMFVGSMNATTEAATISGVTVEDFSSELSGFGARLTIDTVNSSGFNDVTGVHDTNAANMWLTDGPFENDEGNDTLPSHITYDLEGNYDLNSFTVWNYNESAAGNTDRGARDVTISVASSEGGAFTSLGGFVFAQAPGTVSNFGQLIDLSSFAAADNVRLLRIDITTNYGDSDNVTGLSEIRFDGDVVVPEPASAALGLLSLGALGAGLRRRRA